jgi:hypothetical protein
MRDDLIYVYCLANIPPKQNHETEKYSLEFVKIGDFYVIVKHVSKDEFDEENLKKNVSDIQWLEINARQHINVINSFMAFLTVVPFKFGTIFQSEESLKKFINDYSDSLDQNFRFIEAKEEWTVKVYCNRKHLCDRIDDLSAEAASLEQQIMASSPGKAFILKRKKNDLIEYEMDRLCKKIGQEFYDTYQNLSEATNLNNLLPKEFTGREDSMILNATFLIKKDKVSEFTKTTEIFQNMNSYSGFFIEMTGPWPPFSFIHIKEK